mgnify:CR=1 FL=1
MTYALLLLSYVLGATPSSYWISRLVRGIDLRQHGSGNLGATNVFRIVGPGWAVPVMVLDVTKGFVPVSLFPALINADIGWALAFGGAAIFGHIFSFWVGFKGGKGVATSAGALLALAPWPVLGCFIVWCLLTFPTGYVALGSIGAVAALPVFIFIAPQSGVPGLFWFSVALAFFVIWAHRTNVRRLLAGSEDRFRWASNTADDHSEPA